MTTHAKAYLNSIVESQGKLFDMVANNYHEKDTEEFITAYMKSRTRQSIDEGQAYVCTMSAPELLEYFMETEGYSLKPGKALEGFVPDWIGEFYAYYQWFYEIPSRELVDRVPPTFLRQAYWGLHDLELDLAVQKVGPPVGQEARAAQERAAQDRAAQ